MNDLDSLRLEIDKIDEQILQLLTDRAQYARHIGEYKSRNNIAVFSQEREERILSNLVLKNKGPLSAESIKSIFAQIITSCRELQK